VLLNEFIFKFMLSMLQICQQPMSVCTFILQRIEPWSSVVVVDEGSYIHGFAQVVEIPPM